MKRNMKNRLFLLLCYLMLSAGIAFFAYPSVSNWVCEYTAKAEIQDYNEAVQSQEPGNRENMLEAASGYNEALSGEAAAVSEASYGDLLAVTDAIAYLEIPKLDVYLPVYHGVDDKVLQKGIGHLPETSLPVGGVSTHCVLSGHSGLPAARLLTDLDRMKKGDLFYIHVMDEILAYEVDQIKTVLPEENKDIQIVEGEDYVTLVTCVPYGINSHRLLVRGKRTEYTAGQMLMADSDQPEEKFLPEKYIRCGAAAVGAVWIGIMLLILFLPERKKKGRDD